MTATHYIIPVLHSFKITYAFKVWTHKFHRNKKQLKQSPNHTFQLVRIEGY